MAGRVRSLPTEEGGNVAEAERFYAKADAVGGQFRARSEELRTDVFLLPRRQPLLLQSEFTPHRFGCGLHPYLTDGLSSRKARPRGGSDFLQYHIRDRSLPVCPPHPPVAIPRPAF